jgi:hypothetical protein
MSVIFDCTDIRGRKIEIKTPIRDAATAVLKDPSAPAEKRELATKVLRWYAQRLDDNVDQSDLGKAAWLALTDYWAEDLWKGQKKLAVETSHGVERMVILDVVEDDLPTPKPETQTQPAEQAGAESEEDSNEPLSGVAKLKAAKDFAKGLMQYMPQSGE